MKKNVSTLIDVSGLISNVGVMVLLIGQNVRNEFFAPLLAFLSASITVHVTLALLVIVKVGVNFALMPLSHLAGSAIRTRNGLYPVFCCSSMFVSCHLNVVMSCCHPTVLS